MRKLIATTIAAGALSVAVPANAATFIVNALTHSSNSGSGTPLDTALSLTAGQSFTLSSSTDDLWSAGALPRFSDANGLTADRFATATDDSGQPVGTQIGQNFGLPTIDGYTAPFGSLVGRINGAYQLLGANFAGSAWETGTLELFYWDTFTSDNAGEISFDVALANAVPEPETWFLTIFGFGVIGHAMRGRRQRAKISFV